MKIIPYSENEHYAMLASWWESWSGWVAIPPIMLPENGLITYSDCGVPLCAGFVYKTDSCIAWIEHIISSKNAKKELRAGSVGFLISQLSLLAKNLGFTACLTSSNQNGLIAKFENAKYQKTDTNTTILTRIL